MLFEKEDQSNTQNRRNMATINVLCIGDVVGATGCAMLAKHLDSLKKEYQADFVIVNGENSANNGRGITPKIAEELKAMGVDVITSGNHIWAKRDIYSFIAQHDYLLRPANYPNDVPGTGVGLFSVKGYSIAVINVQGRVFMREQLSCPFRAVESILTYLRDKTKIIIVDVHAETTSEKSGLGFFLDGKVSAVVGTHTHVQTADEKILPQGTAFITDLGMVGSYYSMLGMKKEPIIKHFLTQMPTRFEVETKSPVALYGACIEIDVTTGHACSIKRIQIIDEKVNVPEIGR